MSPPSSSIMTPQNPSTRPPPTADDLIFLLSIVRNPNSVIAEQQKRQTDAQTIRSNCDGKSKVGETSSSSALSWQHILASLPLQRRDIILTLQRMANARQKWNNVSSSSKSGRENNESSFDGGSLQHNAEAEALQELEDAATAIRTCTAEYLESIEGHKSALQQCWLPISNNHATRYEQCNYSELANVGRILASQLMHQLQWDERLGHAILIFIDEELYSSNSNNANEKLRVWADAMSKTIKINKSYWEFVEREVYDETELEAQEDSGESPQLLNGEPSTKFITIGCLTDEELKDGGHLENIMPVKSTPGIVKNESLHEQIVSCVSVEETIETFIRIDLCRDMKQEGGSIAHDFQQQKSITSILLVGEEGCGKTHLLDYIQQSLKSSKWSQRVKVLRPKYPVDLVGNSIGSSEDRLIALFAYASRIISTAQENGCGNKCLIMLDDIDRMFSLLNDSNSESSAVDNAGSSTQYYIGRRCKALFVTILDALCKHSPNMKDGHLLLLCTARSRCGEVIDRFDRTFKRGQPDEKQRRQLITMCFSLDNNGHMTVDGGIEAILSLVVHHSAGRSAFELAQCCREAILSCADSSSPIKGTLSSSFKQRLQYLDKMLQMKSPQSLRGGALDGVVEMRVFTPEELQSKLTTNANGDVQMPLLGAEAKRAHEALMNVVITPLCRSDEIRALLYGGPGNGGRMVDAKPIRVGALLAGGPGVGKTSLAYHCASLAAKMSRVSLLDVSCTSLIHKEIGGSERAVQRLFAAVRAAAPCILLLDGIECVAPKRGNDNTSEGTMDRVLSTFLTEMDGIESGGDGTSGNVAVIGVTHNPNLIDPSLLRPGRLEKTIILGTLDFDARKEIISRQIKAIDFDFKSAGYFDPKNKDDVSRFVAMESAGMSAVEAIAICREASMECLRELNFEATEKPTLTYEHFKSAIKILKGNAGKK